MYINKIEHHVVEIKDFKANGKVKRVIRTIRNGLVKFDENIPRKKTGNNNKKIQSNLSNWYKMFTSSNT